MRLNMTDRHMPLGNLHLTGNPQALPRNTKSRLPAGLVNNLNVRPRNPPAPSRPQNLQHRLFSREPARQMLEPPLAVLQTIRLLRLRKTPIQKMLPMLLHQLANPRRLHDVNSMTHDRHPVNLDRSTQKEKTPPTIRRNNSTPAPSETNLPHPRRGATPVSTHITPHRAAIPYCLTPTRQGSPDINVNSVVLACGERSRIRNSKLEAGTQTNHNVSPISLNLLPYFPPPSKLLTPPI